MSTASSNPEDEPKRFGINSKTTGKNNFGSPLRVVLTTLLFFILSQLVAGFIVGAGLKAIHGHANLSEALQNSAPAQFFYILLAEGLAVVLVFWLIRRRRLSFAAIGWGRMPRRSDLRRGLIGFGAFYLLVIIATTILALFFPHLNIDQKQDIGFNSLPTWYDGALAFFALVLLPPFGEETLVRGYLYSGLRSRWRFVPAMILTSLFFAAAHLELGNQAGLVWGAALTTLLLSVVLVYLRETTGALYAGILVHGLNNVIAFFVHFHG